MKLVIVALMSVSGFLSTPSQTPKYTEYGQATERGGTRVAFWDNEKNEAAGQAAIEFGRPQWKPEYAEQLDAMTAGKTWRMGENFWTTLDTNIPIAVGGVNVPAGYYYVVIRRTRDGARWSLAFLDPNALRKNFVDPFEVGNRPAELPILREAPLEFETSDSVRDRLAIRLTEESLRIEWGTFALVAPVAAEPR